MIVIKKFDPKYFDDIELVFKEFPNLLLGDYIKCKWRDDVILHDSINLIDKVDELDIKIGNCIDKVKEFEESYINSPNFYDDNKDIINNDDDEIEGQKVSNLKLNNGHDIIYEHYLSKIKTLLRMYNQCKVGKINYLLFPEYYKLIFPIKQDLKLSYKYIDAIKGDGIVDDLL